MTTKIFCFPTKYQGQLHYYQTLLTYVFETFTFTFKKHVFKKEYINLHGSLIITYSWNLTNLERGYSKNNKQW